MIELRDALAAKDWSRGLVLALDAWRAHRTTAMAELVDAIAARCVAPVPPRGTALHGWWMTRALACDPLELGALLATLRTRAQNTDITFADVRARWGPRRANAALDPLDDGNPPQYWFRNVHERVAALLEWPDDPRLAAVFVDLIARPPLQWIDVRMRAAMQIFTRRVIALADMRVLPVLQRTIATPRGVYNVDQLQVALATNIRDGLYACRPPEDPPIVGECAALVAPPPKPPGPSVDLDALWREVAANPDDVGTRAILGDALVLAGDLRGDIIVLQCSGRASGRPMRGGHRSAYDGRARTLLRKQWEIWLGDAALVLVRTASEFQCGMLEVAGIGDARTPPWAWDKLRGHRELVAVHTVRPRWVKPEHYAKFVAALPRDPKHLVVHDPKVFAELAKIRPRFQTRVLELCRDVITWARPNTPRGWGRIHARPLAPILAEAATLLPDVADLRFREPWLADAALELLLEVVPKLPAMFPALQRIEIDEQLLDVTRNPAVVAAIRNNPLVDVMPR